MNPALVLLNKILAAHPPNANVNLKIGDAELIGKLGPFALGNLSDAIRVHGVRKAMETEGLFGRKVFIIDDSFEPSAH